VQIHRSFIQARSKPGGSFPRSSEWCVNKEAPTVTLRPSECTRTHFSRGGITFSSLHQR